MNGIRARLDYILKHNNIINKIFKIIMSAVFRFLGLFIRTDQNSVIFSGHSRKYNDSPRAIYEYMLHQPELSDMRFVWALEDPEEEIPGNCIKVKSDTVKYFIETLRCKYWVTCVNIERGLKYKKKKTIYLNTWHGTPLKTIGNAAEGRKDYNFSNIDYFCSSGEYESNIYIRDLQVKPDCLLCVGLPRNDELYHITETEISKIREKLDIPCGKKVILYAPTWRESEDGGKTYGIRPPIDFNLWKEKLSNDYILLLRTHPYTNTLLGVEFDDFVRDFTDYPAINDLLKIADILISDYSATIFDFAIMCKPIICFGYDYDFYIRERGLYMDLQESLPSGVLSEQTQVIDYILHMDVDLECQKSMAFRDRYLQYGGNATAMCAKVLLKNKLGVD